ncbi:NADP-dependent oxidoreductase [Virgibacillus halodenitrificans]|uniref:NADP-dependent oxidoreductase n=1 Tax=Virgibacillus halodenitrificans TaxID=1482 RepID=UPI001F2419A2|nr:NADP-dependent oxidoreductase [Virgibacillus halodenitrificans]MCG1028942.1 NADP-dependent oxidoreductase [Virgibacillus halodenitrificans]
MSLMKAFVRTNAKTDEVEIAQVPLPEISEEEVLVQVEAFGVGIHDRYFIPKDAHFPYVIGTEGSGKIVKIRSNVTNFSVGDRVIFTTNLQPKGGAWAEYAAANKETLIAMPDHLTYQQGAAIPVAGKTALESMRELDLKAGDSLFVAGASGAIGTYIVQLATALGIHVAGSASSKNHEYMQSLGAEKTVDYHDPDWQQQVIDWARDGVTAALAIQPGTEKDSMQVVKDGGKVITVSGYGLDLTSERNITVQQMGHHPETQKKVIALVKQIAAGDIQLVIEKEFSFEEALEALKKTETRHARGKLVVTVGE